jgi:hypothetical protein
MSFRTKHLIILIVGLWQSAIAAPTDVFIRVHVQTVEWGVCGKNPAIKTSLEISLKNLSSASIRVGKIVVNRERIYHKGSHGLELVRNTESFDEFVPPDGENSEERVATEETVLQKNAVKVLSAEEYIYLDHADLQYEGRDATIIASFHVSNVHTDGTISDYWTDPTTIKLPSGCAP